MNIFALFEVRVREAVEALTRAGQLPEGLDLGRVVVEPPRDPSHGDLATNAALVLAKGSANQPRRRSARRWPPSCAPIRGSWRRALQARASSTCAWPPESSTT